MYTTSPPPSKDFARSDIIVVVVVVYVCRVGTGRNSVMFIRIATAAVVFTFECDRRSCEGVWDREISASGKGRKEGVH